MEFTPEKLSEARKYGYTDDEIWDFLGKQDTRYGEAKKYGYSIDETITEFSKLNAPQGTSFTKEVEQIGPAFIESLGRPLENMGETFDVLGFKGVASALKGAITEPENYVSASQRFTEPSPEEPQFLGFAWQYAPRAAVEQAGQALGSMVTGVAGRAIGGLAGAPTGPAGAAVGQAVGAFVGPAIFEAAQIIGPIAKDRAKNNGREVPTNDDILAATVAATGSGALNAIGAKYLPGGEKATVKFFKQLASSFAGEGLTEASQSIVEQIGSTAGTEAGLNINYKQALAEGLIGGVTGAGLTGITAPFTKPAENQVIKTPEQAEEIDIDSKANEEALSLIGAPADQAKNDQIVKIKELESVIANNEMLSQALEPNTPEAQRIDLENKVARDEIEKSKVELEKSVGLTPVEDVKTIQKRIDDSKIQLTGLEPTSRKARSIEAQIAQDEARIKALSESIAAPAEEAVTPPVEPAPVTPAQPVAEAPAVAPAPVALPAKEAIINVDKTESFNQELEQKKEFNPPSLPSLQDARSVPDRVAKKGDKLSISGGSQESVILNNEKAKKRFDEIGYDRQEIILPDDINDKVSSRYGASIAKIKSIFSMSWLGAHFHGGIAVSKDVKGTQRGRVVAHELGHASHSLLGDQINKDQEVIKELGKIEQLLYPGLREKIQSSKNPDVRFFNYLLSADELIAEFNVERITNPEQAAQVAPKLTSLLESVEKDKRLVADRKAFPIILGVIRETKERLKVKGLEPRKVQKGTMDVLDSKYKQWSDQARFILKRAKQGKLDWAKMGLRQLKIFNKATKEFVKRTAELSGSPELMDYFNELYPEEAPAITPAPVTTPPVTEAVTPAPEAAPTGIAVGNRIKLGKSPQTYIVEEVIPQTEVEKANNEQFYSVKNEMTGEVQTVEKADLIQVKGKGARKMVTAPAKQFSASLESGDFASAQAMVDQGTAMDRSTFLRSITPSATQRATTIHTRLEKDGIISKDEFSGGRGLVYGDGRGTASAYLGSQSYEPFPPAGFSPDYTGDRVSGQGDAINKKFNTILNTFVLNVVDSQTRAFIVKDIGNLLQKGGRAVFVTRGADVANSKALVSFGPLERIQRSEGKLTYQKGFTQSELIQYIQETLGEGFTVRALRGGDKSDVRVEVIKNTDTTLDNPPLTSPDIRRQAIDTTPEGILITPPDQQYTFEEVFDASNELFGGQIPDSFSIINDSKDKDYEFKAAYSPSTGQIILNRAYLNKGDNIRDAIVHELGHYIYSDPEFKVEFDKFMASLSPDVRSALDKYVEETYNKETGEIRLEEKKVRAFVDKFIREEEATTWQKMINAIKKFLNKLGFKFEVNDRDAIAVFTAALNRYKSGEFISRTGEVRKMAATPRSKDTEKAIKNAKQIEEITQKTLSNLGADISKHYNAYVNEGKSEDKIAEESNTTIKNVRSNIVTARNAIRDALKVAKIDTNQKPENTIVEWTTGAVKRYLTKEGNLPGGTFQNWVRRNAKISKEAEEVRQSIQDLYDGLRKKYNINKIEYILKGFSSIPPEDVAQINDALAGEIPIAEMPEEIQGPLTRMRQHIDAMSSELIATGQLPEHIEAKAMENIGIYLTRSYKIFTDPKWINKIPQDKLTAARNFLYQQEVKRNPDFTIEDADRKLQQMLNDWQGEKDVEGKRGGKLGAKDLSVMMTRSDIPKQLRDVMGENTNVIFNYANTIAKISRFVADQNFLEAVKKEGAGEFLYTKDNAPNGFNTLIAPEESRTMAPLSGLRTSPEIAKAFEEFGKAYDASANPFLYMFGWLNAVGKANLTVGSVLTQMRNIIGQPFFFLSNGHADIGVINKEVESIMKSKSLNKEQARNELVKMAAGEGLVGENAYAGEMREAFDQIGLKTFEDMEADEFSRQFVALRLFKKGTQGAQNIYQKTDEVGKMIGWLNETKRIQKMNPSMSRDEAMAIASERTRNTYPTYSQGSEALKLFRRQPFFGPFATFFYETFRTTYWNVRYAYEDINSGTAAGKQEGIKRLAGTMAQISIGAFAVNAISSMIAGIGDKEEEDVRRMLPPWAQDASLLWFPKTKDGVYDFINFSYINPYNALSDPFVAMMSGFSRGDDPTEIFIKAAGSFLSPFTSEQPVTAATIDALRNTTETGTKIYNVEDDLGTKTSKILLHIFGKAFTPGTIDRLRKRIIPALYGETVGTRAPAPLKEIGAELTGIRFENLDMRSAFQNKAWEFSRAQNDSERIFRDVATRRRRVTEEEQVDAYKKSEQSRFDNWQEMYRNYMAVRRAGASAEEAVRLMTDIKISKKEASLIAKGMYRPYEVSDEVRRRSRLNGNTIPLEQINQIRQSMPKVLEDVK